MPTLHGFGKEMVYQGPVLTVNKYQMRLPDCDVIERDIVEHPESVLVLLIGQQNNILLIEEYDLVANTW